MKYLNHLSDLLYRTQKIDYIAERKDLAISHNKIKSKIALKINPLHKYNKTQDSFRKVKKSKICLTEST